MKIYNATITTRDRFNIPFNCWMDAGLSNGQLKLNFIEEGIEMTMPRNKCTTKSMGYEITYPFYKKERGTKLELIPDEKNRIIHVKVV